MNNRFRKFFEKVNSWAMEHCVLLIILTVISLIVIECVDATRLRLRDVAKAQQLADQEMRRQESLPAPESGHVELRGVSFDYKVIVIDGHEYIATKVSGYWTLCPKIESHGP